MSYSLPAPFDVKLMNVTATVLFVGVAALGLAAVSWWALRHPAFNIGRIVVEGELVHNNTVTLRANVAPVLTGNFFTVDLKGAKAAFEQVPWVREAQVRRDYPNSLRVILHEHVAEAFWGPDSGTGLINSFGEVFEANLGELDRDGLPRLQGPEDSAPQMLQMYRLLVPAAGAAGCGDRRAHAQCPREAGSSGWPMMHRSNWVAAAWKPCCSACSASCARCPRSRPNTSARPTPSSRPTCATKTDMR